MGNGTFLLPQSAIPTSKHQLRMLSIEQTEKLLKAHDEFIKTNAAELIDLLKLVETAIPDGGSQERKEWTTHMGCLIDVWDRHRETRDGMPMVPWPNLCDLIFAITRANSNSSTLAAINNINT